MDGKKLGAAVVTTDGTPVLPISSDGENVGWAEGLGEVGTLVGRTLGLGVGDAVITCEGENVGEAVGPSLGT